MWGGFSFLLSKVKTGYNTSAWYNSFFQLITQDFQQVDEVLGSSWLTFLIAGRYGRLKPCHLYSPIQIFVPRPYRFPGRHPQGTSKSLQVSPSHHTPKIEKTGCEHAVFYHRSHGCVHPVLRKKNSQKASFPLSRFQVTESSLICDSGLSGNACNSKHLSRSSVKSWRSSMLIVFCSRMIKDIISFSSWLNATQTINAEIICSFVLFKTSMAHQQIAYYIHLLWLASLPAATLVAKPFFSNRNALFQDWQLFLALSILLFSMCLSLSFYICVSSIFLVLLLLTFQSQLVLVVAFTYRAEK